MRKFSLFLFLAILFAVHAAAAKHYSFRGGYPAEVSHRQPAAVTVTTIVGRVTWVSDGDTVFVTPAKGRRVKVRLYGIDAPESDQPWGAESKAALIGKIHGKEVTVRSTGRDSYDRLVGRILLGDEDVNAWMIAEGHAWWYRHYAGNETAFGELEKTARAERRGLWSRSNPVNPYDWRKAHR